MELENFWKIKKKLTFTDICVEVRRLGDDYHILVSGGECPHIGCTVLQFQDRLLTVAAR